MAKVFIEESTLTSIGDAIRAKTGATELISPADMATEIEGIESGGGTEVEPIVLTGNCEYECISEIASKYIELYGDTITTNNITNVKSMFYNNNTIQDIPFSINITSNSLSNSFYGCRELKTIGEIVSNSTVKTSLSQTFYDCVNLKKIVIKNMVITELNSTFHNCNTLHELVLENIDMSQYTSGYSPEIFYCCYSLRHIPDALWNNWNPSNTSASRSMYNRAFCDCWALEEIIGLPIQNAKMTSNMFNGTFKKCHRLAEMTFKTNEDETAMIAKWTNQTIDLSMYVGWTDEVYSIPNYSDDITLDDYYNENYYDSYNSLEEAIANNPNWYSSSINAASYTKQSAINTINSLPDTSAYIADNGGTNTIIFAAEQASARLINGESGRIGDLTAEQIAVATAKGWTVSLT